MSLKGRMHHNILHASFAMALCLMPVGAQQSQDNNPPHQIIRKAGGVLQGSASKRVEPKYPPLAAAAKVSGSVVVEVMIHEEGKVFSARALSGHPLLGGVCRVRLDLLSDNASGCSCQGHRHDHV